MSNEISIICLLQYQWGRRPQHEHHINLHWNAATLLPIICAHTATRIIVCSVKLISNISADTNTPHCGMHMVRSQFIHHTSNIAGFHTEQIRIVWKVNWRQWRGAMPISIPATLMDSCGGRSMDVHIYSTRVSRSSVKNISKKCTTM